MLHEKWGKKLTHFTAKIWACTRFLIDPIAIICCMKSEAKNWHIFVQKYEHVSRFLINPIAIIWKVRQRIDTFLCKHKIFIMAVYMIFKYSKRFRFAPLNKVTLAQRIGSAPATLFSTSQRRHYENSREVATSLGKIHRNFVHSWHGASSEW